jgi:hypothetical protein
VDVLRSSSLGGAPRRSWLARARARGDADLWLRASEGRFQSHPTVAWRTAELTSSRERRTLARSLRGVVADVNAPLWAFSASPLNHRGLLPYVREIQALADRVGDFEQPVAAAGIVLVRAPCSAMAAARSTPAATSRISQAPSLESGRRWMFDLAAIGVAVVCFLFIFTLLYALERV